MKASLTDSQKPPPWLSPVPERSELPVPVPALCWSMIFTLLAPVAERRSRAASASLRLSNMAVIVRDIYSLLHSYRACRTAARALPPTGRQSFPVRRPKPALVLRYSGMRPLWTVGLLNLDHGEPFRAAPERSKPFERSEFFARRVESRFSRGRRRSRRGSRRRASRR